MRCLSPSPKYSIQVFEGKEQIVQDARGYGGLVALEKPIIANFERLGLLDWEIEAALESFNFNGLPEGVNPLTRIGVFDTELYAEAYFEKAVRDERLVQMDERLRELQRLNPSQFIIVEPPESPRPWPSYDEDTAEDVLKFQERLGFDPTRIRKYEEEHEARAEIIETMLDLEFPDRVAEREAAELAKLEAETAPPKPKRKSAAEVIGEKPLEVEA